MGGLTTHPFNPNFNRSNVIGSFGTIYNPYNIIMVGDDKIKAGVISGFDSIEKPIFGPILSFKLHDNISAIGGFYNDNGHNKVTFKLNNVDYTPVIGGDIHFKLYNSNKFSIESHNVISIITTHSIGINIKF